MTLHEISRSPPGTARTRPSGEGADDFFWCGDLSLGDSPTVFFEALGKKNKKLVFSP